jgi:putative FmdB family regulatory protein
MPLVEFLCPKCGHRQERIMKEPIPRMRCEKCASFSIKQFSAPTLQFKGLGFHKNDYPKSDTF